MNRFAALSDPNRLAIVELLGAGEQSAGAIAANFPISAPAVSQHLKTLRDSGLVQVRIDGQRRIYSLDPDALAEMEGWFARVRGFWTGRLDALERALADDQRNDEQGEEE
jgi:DNA-binding transcriptional ArsR family regulator